LRHRFVAPIFISDPYIAATQSLSSSHRRPLMEPSLAFVLKANVELDFYAVSELPA
jgi:hypothetical protein